MQMLASAQTTTEAEAESIMVQQICDGNNVDQPRWSEGCQHLQHWNAGMGLPWHALVMT